MVKKKKKMPEGLRRFLEQKKLRIPGRKSSGRKLSKRRLTVRPRVFIPIEQLIAIRDTDNAVNNEIKDMNEEAESMKRAIDEEQF